MGIVHQQRQIRDVTIDARPNEPDAVTSRLTSLEAELRAVTSLVAELASRVTSLEARDVTQRHAHAERQHRYRERKKQQHL